MDIVSVVQSKIGILVCAGIVAMSSVFAVSVMPLGAQDVRIVKLNDTFDIITLKAGERLDQRAELAKGRYSGVTIFSNEEVLGGRSLRVVILNNKGDVVATGATDTASYYPSANALRIDIPTTWFFVEHKDAYRVEASFSGGDDLSLRSIPRNEDTPVDHKLSINGEVRSALVSLLFTRRVPAPLGARQGVLVGAIFMFGVAVISILKTDRKKLIAGVALIVFTAPLSVLGYFFSSGDLGIADWDFYIPLHDSYRKAIVQYHTFPFWDPYPCGGTAGLGDPEFPVFSPTFLLELVFGVPIGVRLAIVFSVIVGALGMLALARRLGRSVEAGLVASLVVAFGTVNLLEITEGHVNVLAAMWIPWIFWAWLGVYRNKIQPLVCGIFLALAFLGGGVYLLMYTSLAFIVLIAVSPDRRSALRASVYSGIWALGLSAIKLVPVLFWLRQFPDDAYASSTFTLPWLVDILFGRHLHGAYVILNQASGWHEYGAYIGYGTLALALIGATYLVRSRIVRALVFAAIATIALSTLGPQLEPLFDILWFFPRSNISRIILFAVIPLGLLASYGADRIVSLMPRTGKLVRALVIGCIAIDVISLTYQVSEQAFILPHVVPAISPAPSPIAYTPDRYDSAGQGSRTTRSADAYFAGYGTEVYCSVLGPKSSVRTIYDEGDTGVVSATDSRAIVTLKSWSYNEVRVHVETPVDTRVVLNANYAEGWRVNGQDASIESNRPAISVSAGNHDLVFTYSSPGFYIGLFITIATLLAFLILRFRR